MGSTFEPDEQPPHSVYLEGFYIDRLEVTRDEYADFVEQSGYSPAGGFRSDYPADEGDLPATNVTWDDAVAYAAWLGKRLPTEAEWEVAARNRQTPRFPWGNQIPFPMAFCEYANWTRLDGVPCEGGPIAVGSRPRGDTRTLISDLAGNVAEWVADWYDPEFYGRPESQILPVGPSNGSMKVVRGGSWRARPPDATTTRRSAADPSAGSDEIGFRCVLPIASPDSLP
jgi:iron(II)-dependent oxidoreductase